MAHSNFKFHIASTSLSSVDLKDIPFLERFEWAGAIQFDSHWSGTPKVVEFQSTINLKDVFYKYSDILVKKAGVKSFLRLFGRVEDGNRISVN